MNELALEIGNTIIYIDDGALKHQPFEDATVESIGNDIKKLISNI